MTFFGKFNTNLNKIIQIFKKYFKIFFEYFWEYSKNILQKVVIKGGTNGVKSYYTIYKMLSQGGFCKILGFIIGHVIKYNQLKWKKTQH
jgi:hypothetical protein